VSQPCFGRAVTHNGWWQVQPKQIRVKKGNVMNLTDVISECKALVEFGMMSKWEMDRKVARVLEDIYDEASN